VKYLDNVVITLRNKNNNFLPVFINVFDNSLSRKWLHALNILIADHYHLEKNYCFLGFSNSERTPAYICDQINRSIAVINSKDIGYNINDHFTVENTFDLSALEPNVDSGVNHDKLNQLHRYFEDLQGVSGAISRYYTAADVETQWHIRQLNLLCHEYESLLLSIRKAHTSPEWRRPSQLMCWLNAPRYTLDDSDFDLFGVDTINRNLGGVYVGVNKAVGKHHWEVFNDEGRDSRIGELTTSTLKSQTEAAGDFDIEWARNPAEYPWQQKQLAEFKEWLTVNGFDPEDKTLTIGHPQVAQVDLLRSFGTTDYQQIWRQLDNYQDVYKISTGTKYAVYDYRWSDADFQQQQIDIISQGHRQ
jgi:hypothetical protein